MDKLAVQQALPALFEALAGSGRAVLSAPPGSGKTTLVPLELLAQPWLQSRKILLLEPRRLAARASAARMASLLGEPLGETLGYHVRLERRVSSRTRIEVVTEGILTRRLQQDPELAGVGLVIFDEFHERSLQADLALALCLDVCDGLRSDLRLLVMSATLDCEGVSRLLGGAPVVTGSARSYPVEISYLSRDPGSNLPLAVAGAIRRALSERQGDLLVFLPGVGEIRAVASLLGKQAADGLLICPLYGDLGSDEQDLAIRPDAQGRRRVVLATSIAETSLTIEGVTTVLDSGWSRGSRFDPNSGLSRLETVRVSRASADQRAGRAGRLGPGACYRLWTNAQQSRLPERAPPEILNADLAGLVLDLAQWGVNDVSQLRWLDEPPAGACAQARDLLTTLEALDGAGRITPAGRHMAAMALHPRLAHMLLRSTDSAQSALAADLAGLISERDILRRSRYTQLSVDIEDRLPLLERLRRGGKQALDKAGVHLSVCSRIVRAARQLTAQSAAGPCSQPALSPGALLALAYPERIARRRAGSDWRYLMASGRGVVLPEGDSLARSEFLVVARLDAGRSEGKIFMAASIDLEQIRQIQKLRIKNRFEVVWESRSRSVAAREKEMLGELVLASRALKHPPVEALRQAMLAGIRAMGLEALPWNGETRQWRLRLQSLRQWQPHANWPDLSDAGLAAGLDQWLAPWLDGITSQTQLKRLDLASILKSQLDWPRQRLLDRLAPTHIQVPSGSRKRLEYRPGGEAPVLKVKLQEMFGLERTPAVCDGEVPVMLHLLSPAQRPVQVTQDLSGFWERTYRDVKKELRGRYPKHYWPDNPWEAQPTARLKPRSG